MMGLIAPRLYNFKVPYHNLQRENSRGDTIEVILHIFLLLVYKHRIK